MSGQPQLTFSTFADSRTGNRGAVSMLESAIDHLTSNQHPGKVNVFTVYPKADMKLPPTPYVDLYNGTPANLIFKLIPLCLLYKLLNVFNVRVPKGALGREMQALLDTELCLMIGGTTFSDAQPIKIPYNIACLLPAIILGKKSMMYSQTLGPFNKAWNRLLARWCFNRLDFIVPRGPESLKNTKSLNLQTPVEYFTDSAFTLIVPKAVEDHIQEKYAPLSKGNKVVGISVNSIVEEECLKAGIDHNGEWAKFIEYLQGFGFTIMLVPHSMRKNSKRRHNNDLLTIDDILTKLYSHAGILLVDDPYDCKELRVVVGLADYYVASRFHSMISALCRGVPVLVFGWGFQKYREVMQEFELESYCHDAKELSCEALVAGFEQIRSNEDVIKKKIQDNLPKVQSSSMMNHRTAWKLAKKK
jgi:colanic acid/amylovoran biosynthesis protein